MQWIGNGRYMIRPAPSARPSGCSGWRSSTPRTGSRWATRSPTTRRSSGRSPTPHVEIESVKWLTLHAAWQLQNGRDNRHASSIAKLSGAVMANQVVDRVLQIHGGMGYTKELPIERWYRELRLLRIFEGTDEIQRRTIARNLIKGHVKLGQLGD